MKIFKQTIILALCAIFLFCLSSCNLGYYSEIETTSSNIEENGDFVDSGKNDIQENARIDYEEIKTQATLLYPTSNDNWEYNVYSDATGLYENFVEITNCLIDLSTDVIEIPKELEGYPVIALGESAMLNFKGTELIIPNTVIYIGEYFCAWCENMESIKLSNSLITVKENAFRNNHLSELNLPGTLREIGECAFVKAERQEGDEIESVILPESLEYIGYCGVEANEITVLNPHMTFGDTADGGLYADVFWGYAGSTTAEFCANEDKNFQLIS